MTEIKQATVLGFDRARGTGWAMPDDLTNDIFIHRKRLHPYRNYLNPGDRIEYEMGEHNGRPCATNIKFIGHPIARQVSAAQSQAEGVR